MARTKRSRQIEDLAVDRQGMGLLAAHVPLSLLIDLAEQRGPHSSEILDEERPTDGELAWLLAGASA